MTQARICTKGLNLSLSCTRNKHMSRRLHVISRQGKGDRFMNVNPDRSCAPSVNLTPLACRQPFANALLRLSAANYSRVDPRACQKLRH